MSLAFSKIGVVGAGAMGRGIVQLFAQAGSSVVLHDTQPAAVQAALGHLKDTFAKLVEKGKVDADAASQTLARVSAGETLAAFAGCDLVIEAIVERLDVEQTLFKALEDVLSPEAVIVTNTSSLSVTAIAAACRHPQRVGGYHFFNPVPLMRIVEVIGGPRTDPSVLKPVCASCARRRPHPGGLPGHARLHRQPRRARIRLESLKALGEGVTGYADIDPDRASTSRSGARASVGPFELLDLTGLDVSHPVMESIYHQYYEEARYRPSVIWRAAAGRPDCSGARWVKASTATAGARGRRPRLAGSRRPAGATGARAGQRAASTRPPCAACSKASAPLDSETARSPRPTRSSCYPMGIDTPPSLARSGCTARRRARHPDALRAARLQAARDHDHPGHRAAWRDRAHGLFASDGARVSAPPQPRLHFAAGSR